MLFLISVLFFEFSGYFQNVKKYPDISAAIAKIYDSQNSNRTQSED